MIFFLIMILFMTNLIKKIKDYNNFTNTNPPYRANFQLYIENGGFSSFQSEYPYKMITNKGSIISSISSLANLKLTKITF